LRFKLSYRELARELGVSVAPSTVLRWVVRYVPEFEKCWQAYERPVGDSWRVDETYLKVGGQWVYLYRSVDNTGRQIAEYHIPGGYSLQRLRETEKRTKKPICHWPLEVTPFTQTSRRFVYRC
jgi:DDE domain